MRNISTEYWLYCFLMVERRSGQMEATFMQNSDLEQCTQWSNRHNNVLFQGNCPLPAFIWFFFLSFFKLILFYLFIYLFIFKRKSILNPPPSSLPIPSLWVVPVHQPQASTIVHWTWTGISFHTWHFTCFNAILPNLATLSLSHRVHKPVLYLSVSFAVSYTGLSLPTF